MIIFYPPKSAQDKHRSRASAHFAPLTLSGVRRISDNCPDTGPLLLASLGAIAHLLRSRDHQPGLAAGGVGASRSVVPPLSASLLPGWNRSVRELNLETSVAQPSHGSSAAARAK
jgi:hypothetical protein